MESRDFINKKRYLYAFLIGTSLFILIFILAYSISNLEFKRVSVMQGNTAYEIFEDKLSNSFFGEKVCSNESFARISNDLGFQGRIIDDLERKLGKTNEEVLSQKKFYTLIEIEHFEFVQQLNKDCKSKVHTILFFYSNAEDYASKSEDVGKLLGVVASDNSDLFIYSFDVNLNSELIQKLKTKYNITAPAIIIDEKISLKFNEISDIGQLEEYLKK